MQIKQKGWQKKRKNKKLMPIEYNRGKVYGVYVAPPKRFLSKLVIYIFYHVSLSLHRLHKYNAIL